MQTNVPLGLVHPHFGLAKSTIVVDPAFATDQRSGISKPSERRCAVISHAGDSLHERNRPLRKFTNGGKLLAGFVPASIPIHDLFVARWLSGRLSFAFARDRFRRHESASLNAAG
jgi:hypothetical protein